MESDITKKIPFFNFLFTLTVPIYHCATGVVPTGPTDERLVGIIDTLTVDLCTAAMSFFFFVSGWLLFRTLTRETYLPKLRRRLMTLFVPFLFWNLFARVVNICLGSPDPFSGAWKTLILLQAPVNGTVWYLQAILLYAVISPVIFFVLKGRRTGWAVALAAVVFCVVSNVCDFGFYASLWGYGRLGNAFLYFPSYLLGCYFGIHGSKLGTEDVLRYVMSFVGVTFLLGCIFDGAFSRMVVRYGPLLLLVGVPYCGWMADRKVYELSFLVFTVHMPLFAVIRPRVRSFVIGRVFHAAFQDIWIRLICFAVTVLVSWVIYAVLSRLAPRFLGLMTGGRSKPHKTDITKG